MQTVHTKTNQNRKTPAEIIWSAEGTKWKVLLPFCPDGGVGTTERGGEAMSAEHPGEGG